MEKRNFLFVSIDGLISDIAWQVVKEGHEVRYFIENQTDPRLVKQIAASSGAKAGGELYPEALTVKGGEADSYIGAFQHNVKAMVASMQ